MTITITLPQDVERAFEERARLTGQTVCDIAAECLANAVRLGLNGGSSEQQLEVEERLAAIARIGRYDARVKPGLGPLPDEATSRDNIYERRGA